MSAKCVVGRRGGIISGHPICAVYRREWHRAENWDRWMISLGVMEESNHCGTRARSWGRPLRGTRVVLHNIPS